MGRPAIATLLPKSHSQYDNAVAQHKALTYTYGWSYCNTGDTVSWSIPHTITAPGPPHRLKCYVFGTYLPFVM